jgi:hypothetical protein
MDMVSDFLGVDQLKTKIYPAEWWTSIWGNELKRIEAINTISDHCQRDVRQNALIYEKLLPADFKASIRRIF